MTLRRCPHCRRHVRAQDPVCPFCRPRARSLATAVTLGSTLVACSGRDISSADADTTSAATTMVETGNDADPTTSPSTTMSGTTATDTLMTSTGELDSSSDDDDSDFSAGFYGGPPPDGGSTNECDVWAQDCPRGEKCMPWANDGGNSWNATRCTPVDPSPVAAGDACEVEGSGVSGIDNCALGSMCWDVDPDTNVGTCIDLCAGGPDNPLCGDPDTSCWIGNDGVLILCLPTCDPFAQDCGDGQGCYPYDEQYVCLPGEAPQGAHGDPCALVNACAPGFYCAQGTRVFGCADVACCTELCDLDAQDPSAVCSEAANGETCTPLAEGPQFNVGVCVLPE